MSRILFLPLTLSLLLAPLLSFANCRTVINEVHQDIEQYSDKIKNQALPWMNMAFLTQEMGPPATTPGPNNLLQHTWRCEGDMYLTLMSDSAGTLINVEGQYSSSEGSGLFSSGLNQPNFIPKKTATPQPPLSQPAGTPTSDRDVLNPNPATTFQDYYAHLRQCIPGNYQYAMEMMGAQVYPKSVIYGQQLGRCVVETSYDTPSASKMLIKCQYKPKSLNMFTDKAAEFAAQGNIGNTRVMATECQAFLDGTPLKHL